jgi:hypothetical protein
MPPANVLRGADVKHVPELSPRRVLHALETQPCEAGGDVRGVPGFSSGKRFSERIQIV